MGNGKGLKPQWNVADPSAGASDEESKEFRAAFKRKMDAVDTSLTYMAGNGDLEVHQGLSQAQKDAYADYQKIAKAVGKADPKKVKKAREKVLEKAEKLRKKAKKSETETEEARQAWLRSEPLREEKAKQIYELEVWGSPEAARLLKGTQIVEWHYAGRRKWAEANGFIEKLKEQVEPLHADYLVQKAAKDTYERERQSFDGHYEPARALPYPSGPMSDLIDELDDMVPLIDAEVGNLDFVKAREQLRATAEKLAELLKLDTRTERQQYMDGVNDLLEELDQALAQTAPATDLKTIQDQIEANRQLMEQAADDDDYSKALKLFFDIKKLVTDFNEGCATWTAAKSSYDTELAAIKANLDRALAAPAPTDELSEPKDEIKEVDDDRKQAVTDLDYPLALGHVQDIASKLTPFLVLLDKHEEAETKYLAEEPALRADVTRALGLSPTDPEIKARKEQIAEIEVEMKDKAKDMDFVAAYKIFNQLKPRVEEILEHDGDLESRKNYETALPAVQDRLDLIRTGTYFKDFAAERGAIEKTAAQMEGAAAGLQFDDAIEKLTKLAELADSYLAKTAEKEKEIQKMVAKVTSMMDAADYLTADDVARQIVGTLSDEELSYLPMKLRNRLMDEMKGGFKSQEDVTALDKLTSVPPAGVGPMDKETAALIKRVETALNSANWLTEDDKARQEIEALKQDELAKLPDDLRARVREALAGGYESGGDTKALRTLDLTDKVDTAEKLIAQIKNLDLSIMDRKGKAFVQDKLKEIQARVKEAKAQMDADAFDNAEKLLDEAAALGQGVMAKIQLHSGFPDPEAIKKLAAGPNGQKVLDDVIASMPDSTSQRALEVAIEERFGMQLDLMDKELDWEELADKDDKSLKHIYEMMTKLPPDHILGNEELDLIERFSEVTDEGGTYFGEDDDTIVLECGRIDPTDSEDLGLGGEPVDPDCAPDPALGKAPAFSFTLLHEIGHSVDDKAKWMQANGKSKKNGGWINYNADCSKIADLIVKKFGCDLDYVKKVLESKEPGDYPDPPAGVDPAKWEKGRNDAEAWCKAIRGDGALWYSGMARTYQIGGRVYQQSYSSAEDGYDEWVSYSLSARNQGFTEYQFRAPGEWFSELYAAYHSGVLPPKHPATAWLKELDKPMK